MVQRPTGKKVQRNQGVVLEAGVIVVRVLEHVEKPLRGGRVLKIVCCSPR